MPIPAIIPAIIAAAGTLGAAGIQASSASKNRRSQERQNAIDRQRAATAYQTAVSDMRAAGMNPITGQNPPQAASTPMPAPQSDMTGVGQVVQQGSQALSQLVQDHEHFEQEKSLDWYKDQSQTASNLSKDYQSQASEQLRSLNSMIGTVSGFENQQIDEAFNDYNANVQRTFEIDDNAQYSFAQLENYGVKVISNTGDSVGHQDYRSSTEDNSLNFEVTANKGISNTNTNSNTHQNNNTNKNKNKHSKDQRKAWQGVDSQNSEGSGTISGNSWTNSAEQVVSDATTVASQAAEAVTGGVGGKVGGTTRSIVQTAHTDSENANSAIVKVNDFGAGHIQPGFISGFALKEIMNAGYSEIFKKRFQDLQKKSTSVEFKSLSLEDYLAGVKQYSYLQSQADKYNNYYNYLINYPGQSMSDYRKFSRLYVKRGSGNLSDPNSENFSAEMDKYMDDIVKPGKINRYYQYEEDLSSVRNFKLKDKDAEEIAQITGNTKAQILDLPSEQQKAYADLLQRMRAMKQKTQDFYNKKIHKKLANPIN